MCKIYPSFGYTPVALMHTQMVAQPLPCDDAIMQSPSRTVKKNIYRITMTPSPAPKTSHAPLNLFRDLDEKILGEIGVRVILNKS